MLVLYQDIIVSIHGINVLTGFVDRRLFCTSEDLVETYMSPASPYCTVLGESTYMIVEHKIRLIIVLNGFN